MMFKYFKRRLIAKIKLYAYIFVYITYISILIFMYKVLYNMS